MDRFGGDVAWSGFESARANLWHRQLHIFLHPFYYIEYGIAQLGALQVWANSKRDKVRALADYKNSLALGGSRPLPELFQAAGCRFEFSEETIQPLAKMLREEAGEIVMNFSQLAGPDIHTRKAGALVFNRLWQSESPKPTTCRRSGLPAFD